MALPTKEDQFALDVSYLGGPLIEIALSSTIVGSDLDVSFLGGPLWVYAPPAVSGGWSLYYGETLITTMYVGETEVTTAYLGTTALKT